jgi:cytochrome P450
LAVARKYDLYSDEFRRRTFETYAEMRERDPVLCQPGIDGETMIWFATRYEEAVRVLLDAPLARLEAEIALTTLLRRLPGLRLNIEPDELYWRPVPLFRSLASLPVAWG